MRNRVQIYRTDSSSFFRDLNWIRAVSIPVMDLMDIFFQFYVLPEDRVCSESVHVGHRRRHAEPLNGDLT